MATLHRVLPILLAAPLAAQAPGALMGTWRLASAPDLPGIIEQATAPMNFITRPIARARLKKTNAAYRQVVIARTPAEVTIQYDDRAAQHMPANGQPVPWVREDGEKFLISARLDREDLIQTYQAEDGERVNVFHVDPATGALSLGVTVKSPRLPKPVTYTLPYRR
jgi:hypothetical protein